MVQHILQNNVCKSSGKLAVKHLIGLNSDMQIISILKEGSFAVMFCLQLLSKTLT